MKNCKNLHPLLSLYRDHALSPAQEIKVQAHLKTCAQARQELEEFNRLFQAMASLPEPQPPKDLHERIMAHLHPERDGRPVVRFRWKFPALGLMAAACLTLFFLVQYPDVMNPEGKKSYAPAEATPNRTVALNKPVAGLPPIESGKAKANRVQNAPLPNAQTYALYAPVPAGSSLSGGNEDLDVVQMKREKKKNIVEAKKELGGLSGESSPAGSSGEISSGKSSLDVAPSSPNYDYSVVAGSSPSSLSEKQAEGSLSNAESAPMASAPPAAAPEANTFAALPPPSPKAMIAKKRSASSADTSLYESWSGLKETTSSEEQLLVTDAESFKVYWDIFQPGQALPEVDFTGQAVVVLTDSQRPTGGYRIHVSYLEETSDHLIIHYKTENPPPDSMNIQALTWPWTLQVISKPAKPVVFQRDP